MKNKYITPTQVIEEYKKRNGQKYFKNREGSNFRKYLKFVYY